MFDPTIGQWFTEDPKGFDAGDPNLRRIIGNGPTNRTDPSGLADPEVDNKLFKVDAAGQTLTLSQELVDEFERVWKLTPPPDAHIGVLGGLGWAAIPMNEPEDRKPWRSIYDTPTVAIPKC